MASVDGSKSCLAVSDEFCDHECGPCKTEGNINGAKQYCVDCSEYLCDLCVKYHQKLPLLKSHKIVRADSVSDATSRRSTVYCECSKNQPVEFYCEEHCVVICSACKRFKHHKCQTPSIQQKCSSYSTSNLDSIISKAKSLKAKYDQLKQDCSENKRELKRSKEGCQKEIKAFRKDLDSFIDTLEKSMLSELKQMEAKENQRIDEQITTLKTALQMLDADCLMLNDAKTDGRKQVAFAADVLISKSLQTYASRLIDFERDVNKINISFETNKKLNDLQISIATFGSLKLLETMDKQRANMVLLDQVIGSRRDVNIKQPDDKEEPWITGCAVMPNNYIVICDCNNFKLKLLDNILVVTNSFAMPQKPYVVSVVDTNNIIVTMASEKKLQQTQVFPQMKMGRAIHLDKHCCGVEVFCEKIYVSFENNRGDGEVRRFDKHGNLQQRLGVNADGSFLFSEPYNVTVGRTGDKVFISDYKNFSVTCMAADGNIIYQYKEKELKQPAGLYCDDTGNILVCCQRSDRAQVITAEGKLHNTILSSKDGLSQPYCVAYRRSDNIIIVGCIGLNHLMVYQLTPGKHAPLCPK